MLTAAEGSRAPIGPAELAAGWHELDLAADGTPRTPLFLIDLDLAADDATVAAATAAAQGALPLLVGVATGAVAPALQPLAAALTVTLVPAPTPAPVRECVAVDDVEAAVGRLSAAVAANPRAAVVLGRVLRQTEGAPTAEGLAAEAAAYSMLLAGPELRGWLDRRGAARDPGDLDRPRVRSEREGDVLRVTLTRPLRRNAMDGRLREALVDALAVAVADPRVEVELTGEGPDFCSGGDLDEFGSAYDVTAAYLVRLARHPGELLDRLRDRVHAHLHGACIGAGIEMPAFAGRVTCEVGMGLIPGAGGTVSIPRRIGRWRTAWMALSGERVDAGTAHEWGLVDELCS
jgi:enoyl-CoA hydratase/carnithine racemase